LFWFSVTLSYTMINRKMPSQGFLSNQWQRQIPLGKRS